MQWKLKTRDTIHAIIIPLIAAGKGFANLSTYSASASVSFPLKMICTAPWEDKVRRYSTHTGERCLLYHSPHTAWCQWAVMAAAHQWESAYIYLPLPPSLPPLQSARHSLHLLLNASSSSHHRHHHRPGTKPQGFISVKWPHHSNIYFPPATSTVPTTSKQSYIFTCKRAYRAYWWLLLGPSTR